MKIVGVGLAGFCATVATTLSSLAVGDTAGPAPVGGPVTINIDCAKDSPTKTSVSQPNTTVTVSCKGGSTVELLQGKDVFDAECAKNVVLSSVCPGATVTPVQNNQRSESLKKLDVFFPQLPPSAQVVCLKCKVDRADCKAVIDVAAARPQGPQACAVAGSSVTLQIKEAGGVAQFACGSDLALMPTGATKAYADDCTKEETLKGMTRTPGPGTYVTLKVDKPKNKKLCYLCKKSAAAAKAEAEPAPCTIYVEVSGSSRHYSSARFGVPLLCIAATLHFT